MGHWLYFIKVEPVFGLGHRLHCYPFDAECAHFWLALVRGWLFDSA